MVEETIVEEIIETPVNEAPVAEAAVEAVVEEVVVETPAEAVAEEVVVEAAADELGTALGGIPIDYVDAAVAIPVLQERLDALGVAKDEAMGHIDAAQGAGDPVSAGLEWLRAAAAAKSTYDAGVLVKDSLGELVGSADGDIRDAFATSPRCSSVDLG